ncbi:hypothetical protein ACHAXA_000347 [Cyclostephanos tholiformis]|uniref:Secreted protein n=1 Tax=Cyclostephanos tholiformis TaxID=382380 RepID=A0ABD3R5G5_9STRA
MRKYYLPGAIAFAILSGTSGGFIHHASNSRRSPPTSDTSIFGDIARSDGTERPPDAVVDDDALLLLNEARRLRAQANELQIQLDREKEDRVRRQREKVDSLIDALLFHGMNYNSTQGDEARPRSKQQLLHTEEQVANLLISKRINYDIVSQMFDRICELSNRPQSVDSCSPLLSLLLDAACKVDCLEREDNPNKRWNHRVERDLRKRLFLLGYGIRIENGEDDRHRARSITGEKDYL